MSDQVPQDPNDPFGAAAAGIGTPQLPSQQPGLFGVSPAKWESIAQLGAGAVAGANQRTSGGQLANGTGPAGAIMGAVQGYYGDVQNQAKLRSGLAQQEAQTQGIGIQNEANRSSLGVTRARNKLVQDMLNSPGLMQQLSSSMGGGIGAGPSLPGAVIGGSGVGGGPLPSSSSGGTAPPAVTNAVWRNESGGSMQPGIVGDGGKAFGPMQLHQSALDDVNRANGTSLTLPQLAANPQLGKWAGEQYLNQQVQRFGPRAGMAAYNAGPGAVQQAVQSGQPLPAQGYVNRGLAGAGQLGPVDPQTALAQSQTLMQQANQLEVYKSLGIPIPGDPAVLRQQAQSYLDVATSGPKAGAEASAKAGVDLATAGQIENQKAAAKAAVEQATAGPIQAQKSANSNVDLRPGGMAGLVDANGNRTFVKNPQLEKAVDPTTGAEYYAHVAPAMPGSPPGTPGTSDAVLGANGQPVTAKVAPQVQEARDKAYADFAGKDTDSFIAANNTQGILTQMSESARTLVRNGGFLGIGPTAPERLQFASNLNDILRTAGLPAAFDPNAIGSWEELTKATKTAGFELSSHYEGHARQAAQTIENATSAVPSEKNSPVGFMKVSAGINEQAQMAIDLHNAKQPVYDAQGDIVQAENSFLKTWPAQMYARRAISTVTPYPVTSDKDLARYLPGTIVTYKGRPTMVPGRAGAPPVPDYIQQTQQTQPQ